MKRRIVYKPVARREFNAACDWYDQQEDGLGDRFAAAVRAILDRIVLNPLMYAEARSGIRRAVMDVFPYSVFYVVEPKRIVVFAVFHDHRDPGIWQRRI